MSLLQSFQFKYTIGGFNIYSSKRDANVVYLRSIRAMSNHFPTFVPLLGAVVLEILSSIVPRTQSRAS